MVAQDMMRRLLNDVEIVLMMATRFIPSLSATGSRFAYCGINRLYLQHLATGFQRHSDEEVTFFENTPPYSVPSFAQRGILLTASILRRLMAC